MSPDLNAPQLELFAAPEQRAQSTSLVRTSALSTALRQTAAALPDAVRFGTSSWTFPGWQGLVYEPLPGQSTLDRRALVRDGLRAYAAHPVLRTTCVDRSWHAPLDASAFANYAAQTPDDFRFMVKAHSLVTAPHADGPAGRGSGPPNPFFLDAEYATDAVVQPFVEGLGARGGPLLFQFSPLGRPLTADPAAFAARLARFLADLPRGPLYAVELRDAALFGDDYLDALADANATHCFVGHPRMPSVRVQAGALARRPGGRANIVRWSLCRGMHYAEAGSQFQPFHRVAAVDVKARSAILDLCLGALDAGRESYVIINNNAEGCAPGTVFALAELLVDALAEPRQARTDRVTTR